MNCELLFPSFQVSLHDSAGLKKATESETFLLLEMRFAKSSTKTLIWAFRSPNFSLGLNSFNHYTDRVFQKNNFTSRNSESPTRWDAICEAIYLNIYSYGFLGR